MDLYNSLYSNRPATEGTPVSVRPIEGIGSGGGEAGLPRVIEPWKHGSDGKWLLERLAAGEGSGSGDGAGAEESIPTNFDPGSVPFDRIEGLVTAGLAERFVNGDDEIVTVDTPMGKLVFLRTTEPTSESHPFPLFRPLDEYQLIGKVQSTYSSEVAADTFFKRGRLRNQLVLSGGLTFTLHFIPFGAAADQAAQGDWDEASLSVAGDVAMFLVPAGKAFKLSPAKIRAATIGAGAIETGIGLYRAGEAIDILLDENGDPIDAAGPAGEALLRLLGVAPSAAKELASLGDFRIVVDLPSTTKLNSDITGGLLSGLKIVRVTKDEVEAATLGRLKLILPDRNLRRAPQNARYDYIDDLNRTYDQIGNPNMVPHWIEQRAQFFSQIEKHLNKADITVVDLTGFPPSIKAEVAAYIAKLSHDKLNRIITIGF